VRARPVQHKEEGADSCACYLLLNVSLQSPHRCQGAHRRPTRGCHQPRRGCGLGLAPPDSEVELSRRVPLLRAEVIPVLDNLLVRETVVLDVLCFGSSLWESLVALRRKSPSWWSLKRKSVRFRQESVNFTIPIIAMVMNDQHSIRSRPSMAIYKYMDPMLWLEI